MLWSSRKIFVTRNIIRFFEVPFKCYQYHSTVFKCIWIAVCVSHHFGLYIAVNMRLFRSVPIYERELFVETERPLRLYMNKVNGKCFVKHILSDSSVVLGHRPRWSWSLYQRYFPFWPLCVTWHPPAAGSLWEGWLHLHVIGWPVTGNRFVN